MSEPLEKLNNTTYRKVANDNPKDRLEIEIGDIKQEDFHPQIKLKRWDNECNFSVRLLDNEVGEATFKKDHEKVNWKKGNIEVNFFEIDNAFKFDYIIKKKPKTNKLQFSIQSKDVVFYYQPPLTQKEIDEGCSRPENVVGSYAVYHSTKGGMNDINGKEYKCGKIGHIFRPHLYDSNGLETWADLHIENGLYEVTIPQDFYDNAVYPIRSNDTFGYETAGESNRSSSSNAIHGTEYSLSQDGIVTKITAHVEERASPDGFELGLYDSGTNKGYTVEGHLWDSKYWRELNIDSGGSLTAGTIRLCLQAESGFNWSYDDLNPGSLISAYSVETYGIWPNTTFVDTWDFNFSIYATYTPSAAGSSSESPSQSPSSSASPSNSPSNSPSESPSLSPSSSDSPSESPSDSPSLSPSSSDSPSESSSESPSQSPSSSESPSESSSDSPSESPSLSPSSSESPSESSSRVA